MPVLGLLLAVALAAPTVSLDAPPAQRSGAAEGYVAANVAPPDTLTYTARAGQPFLVSLPARVDGREASYRTVEVPALSWLVDRSFFWNVLAGERGTLAIRFERRVGDGAPEPFVLLVEIVP